MNSSDCAIANSERAGSPAQPLVTVVMCVYNAGEYLRPALQSVIGQTYRNLDILIVDDGSTDGCFDTVRDLLAEARVRIQHQTNATKPVAMNRALDMVRGEYYAIQDADDISYPCRIEQQVLAMQDNPSLAAVFCGNELIMNGRIMAPLFSAKSESECKREIDAFCMPALDPTGMFRMSLVGKLRYDVSMQFIETFDYIMRVGELHPVQVLGECLYSYRVLRNSATRRDPGRRERSVAKALKRACERRQIEYDRVLDAVVQATPRSRNSAMDNNLAAHFIRSVLDLRRVGRRCDALKTGWECVKLQPTDSHYYKALAYALISPGIIAWLRQKLSRHPSAQSGLESAIDKVSRRSLGDSNAI